VEAQDAQKLLRKAIFEDITRWEKVTRALSLPLVGEILAKPKNR